MNRLIVISGFWSWLQRAWAAVLLGGRTLFLLFTRKLDVYNTLEQMRIVGPESLSVTLVIAVAIGMIFTMEIGRALVDIGAARSLGGFLALVMGRELTPLMVATLAAGRVGARFTAEIGTMRVTKQIDALCLLNTDLVEYLVIPRLVACCVMIPALIVLSLITSLATGLILANSEYDIAKIIFLNSIRDSVTVWDIVSGPIKGVVFGALIAIIGCSWGLTTSGGSKGVGQSTTAGVVTSLLAIVVVNVVLSWLMYPV